MKRNLALEFARVTEAAALASYKWIGRGDKEAADQAAVDAMREMLNRIDIQGEIVIGEGEIDEAPMLYIGEKVGKKESICYVDIAVDPLEGTKMTAKGQPNAISVIAVGNKGSFLHAPDMYMEKLCVGPNAKGAIDLNKSIEENVINCAKVMNKEIKDFSVVILDKPRHQEVIQKLQKMGVIVKAIPDGDVAASLLTAMVDSGVDMLYGIGGAPEGVISAAALRGLGGDMNARLKPRNEEEIERSKAMGIDDINRVLKLEELVKDEEVVFAATGVTAGDLLKGVKRNGNIATTETLVIRGETKTIRYITSIHNLDYKPENLKKLLV